MSNIRAFEEHLTELKRMLALEDEFSDTFKYFFDYLGENRDFVSLGKRAKNPDLKNIIKAVGESVLNEEVKVTGFLLTFLKEHRFYHGGCQVNGRMATVFFFREISMGMVAMLHSMKTHNLSFIRFTTFESANKRLSLHGIAQPTLH